MQRSPALGQIALREGNFDVPLAHFGLDYPNIQDSTGIKFAEDVLPAEFDAERTAGSTKNHDAAGESEPGDWRAPIVNTVWPPQVRSID
jgi:hypothetical protein